MLPDPKKPPHASLTSAHGVPRQIYRIGPTALDSGWLNPRRFSLQAPSSQSVGAARNSQQAGTPTSHPFAPIAGLPRSVIDTITKGITTSIVKPNTWPVVK